VVSVRSSNETTKRISFINDDEMHSPFSNVRGHEDSIVLILGPGKSPVLEREGEVHQVQYEVLILEALPHDTTTRPIKRLICSVSLTVWFNAVWMYLTTKNGSSFMMSVSQPAPKIDH
jgi:hypothetical protein